MSDSPVQLLHATAAHLDAILALERATQYAPHWPPAAYSAIIAPDGSAPRRCLIVAEVGETLVGFAVGLMHPAPDPDCGVRIAELESVGVTASARRAGIGRALCGAVFEWCRAQGATEIVLEVRASNQAANSLYAKLGFTQTGRRPHYYRDPEDDALAMRLELVCHQARMAARM
jgi:ribosomal-protein-alanine acetyltransferase